MPYYFTCCNEDYQIFTGIDAKENDLLARWGWDEDILFHVGQGMPGGHIYLRTTSVINKKAFKKIKKLSDFESMLDIPSNVIDECLQLAKQYSSKGRKEKSVQIHISPWLNVRKYDGDNYGTIQFVDHSLVKVLKASTNENMVDALQETRTKKKMKEDDFRKQRDSKYGCYGYANINYWARHSLNHSDNHHLAFRPFGFINLYPFIAWRHRNLCSMKLRIRPNMIMPMLRRLVV